jgi:hypothetical protein
VTKQVSVRASSSREAASLDLIPFKEEATGSEDGHRQRRHDLIEACWSAIVSQPQAGLVVTLRDVSYACPPRPQPAPTPAARDGAKFRLKTGGNATLCLGRIPSAELCAEDFTAERDACIADEDTAGTSDEARALILRSSAEGARWLRLGSRH